MTGPVWKSYSKWDNIDSDSEEEAAENVAAVKKLTTPTRMSTMDDIDDEADEDPYENVPAHVTIPGRKITKEEHRSELQRMQDKLTRRLAKGSTRNKTMAERERAERNKQIKTKADLLTSAKKREEEARAHIRIQEAQSNAMKELQGRVAEQDAKMKNMQNNGPTAAIAPAVNMPLSSMPPLLGAAPTNGADEDKAARKARAKADKLRAALARIAVSPEPDPVTATSGPPEDDDEDMFGAFHPQAHVTASATSDSHQIPNTQYADSDASSPPPNSSGIDALPFTASHNGGAGRMTGAEGHESSMMGSGGLGTMGNISADMFADDPMRMEEMRRAAVAKQKQQQAAPSPATMADLD